IAAWLCTVPLVIAMGVRSWPPVLLTSGLCTSALAYAIWIRRRRDLRTARVFILIALVYATIASVACWMGSFVLVPQAAAVTALWIALVCHPRRERWAAVALGVLAVILPFAMELVGILPPGFVFANGDAVIKARAVRLTAEGTLPMLVYASAT